MSLVTSMLLIYTDTRFNLLSNIMNIKNIELYFSCLFVFLSLNFKHLRGTTYRKSKTLVNYKIASISKFCIIFTMYSSILKLLAYLDIDSNTGIMNSLFCLYLPYYLDFAEYTGKRRIIMPSFFHNIMNIFYRMLGTYRLINDSVKLEKNIDTPSYILGVHPHGLFPFGSVGSLALPNNLKYIEETTPILNTKYLKPGIASFCFYIPIIREIYLWLGAVDCSKPILKNLLVEGNSVAVFVGGAQEAQYSGIGSTKLILKNRDGIFKLALETGSSLVPVYTFGNNNIYNSLSWDLFGILDNFKKITGLWLPRGYFVPMRHNFVSVIGKPITVKKLSKDDDLDNRIAEIKDEYMFNLTELFDKYKYLDPYSLNKSIEYI